MSQSIDLVLRELEIKDLEDYLYLNHPSREFHKWNGPYYRKKNEEELKRYVKDLREQLLAGQKNVLGDKRIIADKDTDGIIGEVNWYWKSEEIFWMEVGIVIFNKAYWGKGIGFNALKV